MFEFDRWHVKDTHICRDIRGKDNIGRMRQQLDTSTISGENRHNKSLGYTIPKGKRAGDRTLYLEALGNFQQQGNRY